MRPCSRICVTTVLALGMSFGLPALGQQAMDREIDETRLPLNESWTHFAGNAERVSIGTGIGAGPDSIAAPAWVSDGDAEFQARFYGQTGLVVSRDLVIAIGFEIGAGGARLEQDIDGFPPDFTVPVSSDDQTILDGPFQTPLPGSEPQPGGSSYDGVADADEPPAELRGTVDVAVAFSRRDGSVVWTADVPVAILDSWSTPAVDLGNNTLLVASSNRLVAIDLRTGARKWTTKLTGIVVNASPVVTVDRGAKDRAFITDHSFAGPNDGNLICVNVDPFDPTANPYQPGEVVWVAGLNGQTSGNTPAYRDGEVYVSTATGGGVWDQGTIQAFPAGATSTPAPLWVYEHTDPTGFFSGVAANERYLWASSYSFTGGQFSASTVKLNRLTGQQIWTVPTNRTDTTPVPLQGNRVLISGGVPYTADLPFFGSLPSVQLLEERPFNTVVVWDTAMDTLSDTNGNQQWDPGESFLSLGSWTIQPIVIERDGVQMAYVGTAPDPAIDGFFGASQGMRLIDLSKSPGDLGFVVDASMEGGSSPAMTRDALFTVSGDGVASFGGPNNPVNVLNAYLDGTLGDMNGDGQIDTSDVVRALRIED